MRTVSEAFAKQDAPVAEETLQTYQSEIQLMLLYARAQLKKANEGELNNDNTFQATINAFATRFDPVTQDNSSYKQKTSASIAAFDAAKQMFNEQTTWADDNRACTRLASPRAGRYGRRRTRRPEIGLRCQTRPLL